MANVITTQVLKNSRKEVIVKVTVLGDGSGEETDTVIFDASDYDYMTDGNNLREIEYALSGFDIELEWHATANIPIINLVEDHQTWVDYERIGGIPNNAGAGRTGDILMTTVGLDDGDFGHIIFRIKTNATLSIN